MKLDDEWDEPWHSIAGPPVAAEVIETENPVVAELLGPSGETLRVWRERSHVRFGFQRSRMRAR